MSEEQDDSIKISRTGMWKFISAILAVLLVLSIYTGGLGLSPDRGMEKATGKFVEEDEEKAEPAKKAAPKEEPEPRPTQAPTVEMEGLIDDDDVKGDADAPVTIIEWSDFECPFCARFYDQTYGQIVDNYVDTGKVKIVYRDFPLGFHPQAQKAAEAAECAGEQDMFWEMHDMLFDEGVQGGVDSFKEFADDLGLDTEEFDDCLDSGDMADEVKADMADGQKAGITGTPGFIINGELVSGAQPYENFEKIIEAALA